MRIGAHPPVALGWKLSQLLHEGAVLVEQLLRPVSAHPSLEKRQMIGVRPDFRERNLVGAPRAFHGPAVDLPRTGPSLRCPQDDHRPPMRPFTTSLPDGALDP